MVTSYIRGLPIDSRLTQIDEIVVAGDSIRSNHHALISVDAAGLYDCYLPAYQRYHCGRTEQAAIETTHAALEAWFLDIYERRAWMGIVLELLKLGFSATDATVDMQAVLRSRPIELTLRMTLLENTHDFTHREYTSAIGLQRVITLPR
jgi:hypothetical protein